MASNSNISPVNVCENYILKLEQCIYLLTKLNEYNNNVIKIKITCSVKIVHGKEPIYIHRKSGMD